MPSCCSPSWAATLLSNPDVTVESISGAAHRQLWMNTREGTFTDVRVRQAVALGINRQELLDVVLKGRGQMGNDHPVAPSYEFFDSTQPQRERDIEKAKALLEEAGKAGLAVTMHVPKLVEIPQLAELMQTQLKDIGMDVTLNVISTDTFYDSWCKVYDSEVAPAGCDGGEEFGIVDYGNRGTPDVYLVKAYATGEWNSAHYISEPFNGCCGVPGVARPRRSPGGHQDGAGHRHRRRALHHPVLLRLAHRVQEERHGHRRHRPRALLPRFRRFHGVSSTPVSR